MTNIYMMFGFNIGGKGGGGVKRISINALIFISNWSIWMAGNKVNYETNINQDVFCNIWEQTLKPEL